MKISFCITRNLVAVIVLCITAIIISGQVTGLYKYNNKTIIEIQDKIIEEQQETIDEQNETINNLLVIIDEQGKKIINCWDELYGET